MNRCRRCNTELAEQARFCNICGSPQTPASPQVEVSTSIKQEIPDQTHRCYKCEAELPLEANFCKVCGSAQRSKTLSKAVVPSEKQVTHASVDADKKTLSGSSQQQQSLIPTRSIHPGIKAHSSSQEGGNYSIRSNTITRSPVVPSRRTNNGVKSPAAPPQSNTVQPALSPKLATSATLLNSSSPANARATPEPAMQPDTSRPVNSSTSSSAAKAESIYNTPTQHLEVPSSPARASELVRPIIPKSPVLSVIPSRPDTPGTPTSTLQISRQMSSTQDLEGLPTSHLSTDLTNVQNVLADTPTMNLLIPENFVATSKAVEHWRKSWHDRQYAEAGPAVDVSRGQASVPMPLLSKQQSFVRLRAIASNNKQQQKKRTLNFGTWIVLFLMICLIVGLGAYIIWSYLPNSPSGITHTTPPVNSTQPTLSTQGTTSQTVIVGQTIQLHGEHFGANHTITFLLDSATHILDASGKDISSQTNSQGTFDAILTINKQWTTGSHSIEAVDNSSNLFAFMTLQVIPAGTPTTSSTELSVTMDNKAVQKLTFMAVTGQANPGPQRITITNISKALLNWSAVASSSNNLSWLTINDNNTFGHLDISQPHDILISVNIVGLKSNPQKPYTGQIVFTINDNQLLTVPVQLWISGATPEMVFSPNPIIVQRGSGNTCNPGVTLTLINLGTVAISWTVNPDDKDTIKFVNNNGQILESGTLLPSGSLLPSGQPGDSVVLNLRCNGIQGGQQYHVSVYANQMSWSEFVIIQ